MNMIFSNVTSMNNFFSCHFSPYHPANPCGPMDRIINRHCVVWAVTQLAWALLMVLTWPYCVTSTVSLQGLTTLKRPWARKHLASVWCRLGGFCDMSGVGGFPCACTGARQLGAASMPQLLLSGPWSLAAACIQLPACGHWCWVWATSNWAWVRAGGQGRVGQSRPD